MGTGAAGGPAEKIVRSKDPGQALDDAAEESTEAIQDYSRRIGG